MRYCHYCGHEVPADARFCPACGKELSKPKPAIPKQTAEQTPGVEEEQPKKQSSLWGCTLIVLLVALLAGGVLFTYNQLFDRSSHPNILAPQDDNAAEETLPAMEQQTTTTKSPETNVERKQERNEAPIVIEEEPTKEVETPEELPEDEGNQIEQETTNNSQDN